MSGDKKYCERWMVYYHVSRQILIEQGPVFKGMLFCSLIGLFEISEIRTSPNALLPTDLVYH